jgi:hypothetical protein
LCVEELANRVHEANYTDLLHIAETVSSQLLKNAVLKFIAKNINQIAA